MQQVNNLIIFLPDIDKLLYDCNISRYTEEEDEVEKLLSRIVELLQVTAFDEIVIKFDEMFEYFKEYNEIYEAKMISFQTETDKQCNQQNSHQRIVKTGKAGRPKLLINEEQVLSLRSLGMTWIAELLGISGKTLYRSRMHFESECSKFAEITDNELNSVVAEIIKDRPCSGERMVSGSLLSRVYKVQRWRYRTSIRRVNPNPRNIKKRTIFRRTYNVPCANALVRLYILVNLNTIVKYCYLTKVKCPANEVVCICYSVFLLFQCESLFVFYLM